MDMQREVSTDAYQRGQRKLKEFLSAPIECSMQQISQEIISGVLSVLKENGITSILDSNSLLGQVRDNYYIPWSKAVLFALIDESLPYKNSFDKINRILTDHYTNEKHMKNMLYSSVSFTLWGERQSIKSLIDHQDRMFNYIPEKSLMSSYPPSKGVRKLPFRKVEFNLMKKLKRNNDQWFYMRANNIGAISHDDIFPIKECDFVGIKTFKPNKAEKHLRRVYGDDWATPITNKHAF